MSVIYLRGINRIRQRE